jgi:hypothetical protein
MQEHERMIRPALGAIVLICFFMPFLKISCGNQPIASITGVDLALGKTVEPPNFFGDDAGAPGFGGESWADQSGGLDQSDGSGEFQFGFGDSTVSFDQSASTDPANPFADTGGDEMKIESEPSAAAALILAIIALLGAFGASHRAMQISAVASGITAALLLVIKANVGGDMPPEMMGIITLEWSTGFWGAVVASVALAIFTASLLSRDSSQRQRPRLVIQSQYDKQSTESLTQ